MTEHIKCDKCGMYGIELLGDEELICKYCEYEEYETEVEE